MKNRSFVRDGRAYTAGYREILARRTALPLVLAEAFRSALFDGSHLAWPVLLWPIEEHCDNQVAAPAEVRISSWHRSLICWHAEIEIAALFWGPKGRQVVMIAANASENLLNFNLRGESAIDSY